MTIQSSPLRRSGRSLAAAIFGAMPLLADEITPAPASVGADVPVTYFGPPPSSVEPELIGPHQLITAGTVDLNAGTVKLPLYKGHMAGTNKNVWYVLTDTGDKGRADALGLNYAAKLQYAAMCKAARNAYYANDGSIRCQHRSSRQASPRRSRTCESAVTTAPSARSSGSSRSATVR